MSNDTIQIQEKLEGWAKETINVYNRIVETLNEKSPDKKWGYYTQSVLKRDTLNPDILILGINPGAAGGGIMTGEELLRGNPCFKEKNDKEIIDIFFNNYDPEKRKSGWDIMVKTRKMLELADIQILNDLDKFVLSNMVFLGTSNQGQIPLSFNKQIECATQTVKLIDILHPKVVLLLGSNTTALFEEVSKQKLETLVPNSISYLKYSEKIQILSIKHTAYHYSNLEMELIGRTIGYVLDHLVVNQECIEKEFSDIIQKFEMMIRINLLNREISRPYKKDKRAPYNKISKMDYTKLVFEFYTSVHPLKKCYVNSKNSIVLSLIQENDNFFINICQDNREEQSKLVEWLRTENYLKKENKLIFPVNTSNKEIIDTIICVLEGIKIYRDKTYQIQ
jgi:hypothetical protein